MEISTTTECCDLLRNLYLCKVIDNDANYWVEEEPDLNDMYVTLFCYSSESHDDENNENITVQFLYLHDDCPYGWDTLAKCGAKYMVIERPKK